MGEVLTASHGTLPKCKIGFDPRGPLQTTVARAQVFAYDPAMPAKKPEFFLDEPVFSEPPPKDPIHVIMQQLLETPGRSRLACWFPGPSTAYGRAASLRRKQPIPGKWEFTGLPNSDEEKGGSNLWIKYVGPEEGEDEGENDEKGGLEVVQ